MSPTTVTLPWRRRASRRSRSGPRWCPGTRRRGRAGSGAGSLEDVGERRNSATTLTSRSSKSIAPAASSRVWYSAYTSACLRPKMSADAPWPRPDRVDEIVLPPADRRVHPAGREALGVEAEVADDVAGEPGGVGLVVDRELPRVAEHGRRGRAGCARRPSGTSTPTSSWRPGRPARRRAGASRRPPCW